MRRNSCYTYFAIKGVFEPDDITAALDLIPSRIVRIGDLRINGRAFDFATWEYGRCDEYDVFVENQMMRTIENLIPKVRELQEIKRKYDAYFYLEVVPSVYDGDVDSPCLSPNRAVIEFCYHTETSIDIDLYVIGSDESD